MVISSIQSLILGFRNRFSSRSRRRRVSPGIACERLEQKIAPAIFNVTAAAVDGATGSLRKAIIDANTNGDASNTITLAAGTYNLTLAGAGENAAATGDLDIFGSTKTLTITGASAATTIINGGQLDRVFDINGATVNLANVTVQGGQVHERGGGIHTSNGANLTVTNSIVKNNTVFATSFADTLAGGGIDFDGGTLTVSMSTIESNSLIPNGGAAASAQGGGLSIKAAVAFTISDSLVRLNVANGSPGVFANANPGPGQGGSASGSGIYIDTGTGTISTTTIRGNTAAAGDGGADSGADGGSIRGVGIYVSAVANLTLERSLIASNVANAVGLGSTRTVTFGGGPRTIQGTDGSVQGVGIHNAGNITINNTTISSNLMNNQGKEPDVGGGIYSAGTTAINFSTIARNVAMDQGGGVFQGTFGNLSLRGALIGENTSNNASSVDLFGNVVASENSLIDSAIGHNVTNGAGTGQIVNNIVGVAPLLNELSDNGVHSFPSTSPAANAGGNLTGLTFTVDQIGQPRTFAAIPDIGALELQGAPTVVSGAPVGTNFEIGFSENINNGAIKANFILVEAGPDGILGNANDVNIDGTVAYNNGTFKTTFTPTNPLTDGKYRLTVKDNITSVANTAKLDGDLNGAAAGDFTVDFTIAPTSVTAITHDRGTAPVAVNEIINYTVSFASVLQPGSLDVADFANLGNAAITIVGVQSLDLSTFNVQVQPTTTGNVQLKLADGRTINDAGGRAFPAGLVSASDTIDVTQTFVTDISHDAGVQRVAANGFVRYVVTFNHEINATTVNAADFTSLGTATFTVDTVEQLAGNTFQVVIKPTGAGTVRLALAGARTINDVSGNAIAAGAVSDDNTVVVEAPSVVSITDDSGTNGVSALNEDLSIAVYFSVEMNPGSVNAADFVNIGSATTTIGLPTTTDNRTYLIPVKATTTGTVVLGLAAGRTLDDVGGTALGAGTVNASVPVSIELPQVVEITVAPGIDNRFVYTIDFNLPIDIATLNAADFENAGTSNINIESITPFDPASPRVFTVTVAPTSLGTLQLRFKNNRTISDLVGNALNPTIGITDDEVKNVLAVAV